MSVLYGGNFSSSKATEENSMVVKKSSKAGLTQRSTHLSIKENPTVHSVKRTSTTQGTPVLTHRHALNDLSNTARKAHRGGISKQVCMYVEYVCISTFCQAFIFKCLVIIIHSCCTGSHQNMISSNYCST